MITSDLSAQEQIEYLATKVMGWEKKKYASCIGSPIVPQCTYWTSDKDHEHAHSCGCDFSEKKPWNPLTDWNHTMQVWQQLVDMKLQVGIDQTEDHVTVTIGRFDALGYTEIFVHMEHADAKTAICLAAIQALKELSHSQHGG